MAAKWLSLHANNDVRELRPDSIAARGNLNAPQEPLHVLRLLYSRAQQNVALSEYDPLFCGTGLKLRHSQWVSGPRVVWQRDRATLRLMTHDVKQDTPATDAVIRPV
ncbi:hypothetical protein DXG01_006943 [Tephrocybe rancida]|nr:hypothetical protein DXG01_006943 [Tephrocybe rancida]